MHHPAKRSHVLLAAVAASSALLLAACGGDTQPAAGASAGDGEKTLVFSPLALKIPAMQGLAKGVQQYAPSQGYQVVVQDPNLDPQKQATDLKAVVESGKADAVWAIAVQPAALADLVKTAQEKNVVLLLNGVPEDYGLSGPQPGITFENIQYAEQGTAIGEELGNCINEKLDGKAQVIFEENAPGTAGKKELETSAKDALAATAPDAEIVATIVANDRAQVQTDIGSALQGHPDVTVVLGNNDEGALGAIGAFKASGKDLTCLTEAGGNDEVLAAVKAGKIYASVALQFQDAMVQDVDHITTMLDDPTDDGEQISVPQKVLKTN
ncbi:MAG: sugar ABC transporter substrate-binding protein [Nocardioides sp.]